MGTLDSNGIYIYDTNDNVAPLATLLNLGQSATSAALSETKEEILDEISSLPEPLFDTGRDSNVVGASTWAHLEGGPVSVSLTLPYAAWVQITGGGVAAVPHNCDLRVGTDVTGATQIAHNSPSWGNSGWIRNSVGGNLTVAREFTKIVKLNQGTNTIRLMAYIVGTTQGNFNYPSLQVTPLRRAK